MLIGGGLLLLLPMLVMLGLAACSCRCGCCEEEREPATSCGKSYDEWAGSSGTRRGVSAELHACERTHHERRFPRMDDLPLPPRAANLPLVDD